MLRLVILEAKLLLREKAGLLVSALLIITCALAFANGRATLRGQVDGRESFAAERSKADHELVEAIATTNLPADAVLLPRRVAMAIVAPVPPLADFSTGRAEFESYTTVARLGLRSDGLFKRSRLDNPELIARGSLDLGFVALVIAPLLLIALGYGIFSRDRENGTARLIVAQAGTPLRLLTARSLPRLALVLVPILVTALLLLASSPGLPGRAGAAASWLLIALLFAMAWWAGILLVNSLRVGAETAALTLVAIWALVTLVLPPSIAAASQSFHPAPSRFEQIATSRAAEIAAAQAFANDHLNLTADEVATRRAQALRGYRIDRRIEAVVDPVVRRFDEQRARQQRTTHALSFLSPTLIAGESLNARAGTDGRTWLQFREAARNYLADLKNALGGIVTGDGLLSLEDREALPRFGWQRPAPALFLPTLYLLALAVLLGGVALRRFQRGTLD